MTVYDGLLDLTAPDTFTLDFNVVIDVANTFNYDPTRGDLLVEFQVRNPAFSFQFDAAYDFDGATTRIWNDSLNNASGFVDYGFGLATQFQFVGDEQDNYTFRMNAGEYATVALTDLAGGAPAWS